MTTKLGRVPAPGGGRGATTAAPASDELVESVRDLVERYCRARLDGLDGSAEVAGQITDEVCRAAAEALRQGHDRGAPFAALVFSIASREVAEAQRRAGRPSPDLDEPPGRRGTAAE